MLFSMLCLCWCYVGHCSAYSNTDNTQHSAFHPFQTFFIPTGGTAHQIIGTTETEGVVQLSPTAACVDGSKPRRARTARACSSLLAFLMLYVCLHSATNCALVLKTNKPNKNRLGSTFKIAHADHWNNGHISPDPSPAVWMRTFLLPIPNVRNPNLSNIVSKSKLNTVFK